MSAPRAYALGTARSRDPRATLAALLPHLPRFGITRLACVTGLDRIGIPVYQAIRPSSRGLSVSQGKGLDDAAAQVSAAMESLECHHAERANIAVRIESRRELCRSSRVVDAWRLPLSKVSQYHDDLQLPWAQGEELGSEEPIYVPFELVHANATVPRLPGSGCFVFSTNGLASGNNRIEAVLHGACEVIERDAESLWALMTPEMRSERRIDPRTIDDPAALSVLARYRDAGIGVMIWEMTTDVGVAALRVMILDVDTDPDMNPYPAAYGAGCHPERGIALCRALTEAAQTRLTQIAGSRDDSTQERYDEIGSAAVIERHRRVLEEHGRRSFTEVPTMIAPTLDAELAYVRERLARLALDHVLIVDLPSEGIDVAFVRTLIPGLEGVSASPSYRPGARASKLGAS